MSTHQHDADPQTPSTKKQICPDAQKLLDQYAEAVSESLMFQNFQFQAVVSADPNTNRYDDLIREANSKRDNAKYSYLNHLKTHGCSYAPPGERQTTADGHRASKSAGGSAESNLLGR